MANTDSDLLTTAQVAEILGRDVSTVNRMAARGDLVPVLKVPGKRGAYLFHPADVDALTPQTPAAESPRPSSGPGASSG